MQACRWQFGWTVHRLPPEQGEVPSAYISSLGCLTLLTIWRSGVEPVRRPVRSFSHRPCPAREQHRCHTPSPQVARFFCPQRMASFHHVFSIYTDLRAEWQHCAEHHKYRPSNCVSLNRLIYPRRRHTSPISTMGNCWSHIWGRLPPLRVCYGDDLSRNANSELGRFQADGRLLHVSGRDP